MITGLGAHGPRCGRPVELLKAQDSSFVVRTELDGFGLIVKWRSLGTFADRVKSRVHATRGFRQWRGAKLLMKAGIPVGKPAALLTQVRTAGSVTREWLVLEETRGRTLLEHIDRTELSVSDQHAVARAVGVQVAAMLRANLSNRDHKPSNLIVHFEESVAMVTLVDTVAIRRRGNPGEMVRMLATLLIEPMGIGKPPRGALAFRALRDACAAWLESTLSRPLGTHKGDRKALRAMVRTTARRVGQYIRNHGEMAPEVDPLAKAQWPE